MADHISQIQIHMVDLLFQMMKSLRDVHQNESFKSVVLKDGNNNNTNNNNNGNKNDNGLSSKPNEYEYDSTSGEESAHAILSKVRQADLLISNLPQIYETEEEQMKQIEQLIQENEKMNEKLNDMKIEAQKAQKKLTNRLKLMTNTIHGTK